MPDETTRRDFIVRAFAISAAAVQTPAPAATCGGAPSSGALLQNIGEIRRGANKVLRATLVVEDENRSLWIGQPNTQDGQQFALPACRENQRMRYFAGGATGERRTWPVTKGIPGPAPTLR